jgi:hypothetical protein
MDTKAQSRARSGPGKPLRRRWVPGSRKTMRKPKSVLVRNIGIAVIGCGCVPFFLWKGLWSEILLKVYFLSASVTFLIFQSYWEKIREVWFWRALCLIVPLHLSIILAIVRVNLSFPQMDRVPRATYGILVGVLYLEAEVSRRVIEHFQPKHSHRGESKQMTQREG